MGQTGSCTLMQGRTARFRWRTGPNGRLPAGAHTSRGVQPGLPGVQAETGTNGYGHTCQKAYSQILLAYRRKLARTEMCTHVQGRTARFPGRKGQNGHEGAPVHMSRGVQPGFPYVQAQTGTNGHVHISPGAYGQVSRRSGLNGHISARAHLPRGVQTGFADVLAETGSNGHVHTRQSE